MLQNNNDYISNDKRISCLLVRMNMEVEFKVETLWSGVWFWESWMSMIHPLSNRACDNITFPLIAAICSGVIPELQVALTSNPKEIKIDSLQHNEYQWDMKLIHDKILSRDQQLNYVKIDDKWKQ